MFTYDALCFAFLSQVLTSQQPSNQAAPRD